MNGQDAASVHARVVSYCTAEMLQQLTRFFSLRFKGGSTACDELGFT